MKTQHKTSESKLSEIGSDFESAVTATQFGLFNLILIFVTITSSLASVFELSSLTYVYPAAQCDLNLSLEDRGLVNAMIYAGMILSCFFWGSLADVFGRRIILVVTHLGDFIFAVMAMFSFNLPMLLVAKFFGGFLINGPSMAITPYLAEFHSAPYRSRVPLMIGLLFNLANVILPLIAWGILPLDVKFDIEAFEFHSWNLLLFVCTLPSLLTGIIFLLLPKSPKYLMSNGKNEEALKIFQQVFHLNTLQNREKYPIKKLINDQQIYKKKVSFTEACKQISPLFSKVYAPKLTLVCLLQLFVMTGVYSFRSWLPEIFQVMNDNEAEGNTNIEFCHILKTLQSVNNATEETCLMNYNNSSVYINSVIISSAIVIFYMIASIMINIIGKKRMLVMMGVANGISAISIYFAPNSVSVIILICSYFISGCMCVDLIIAFIVDLFPTYLRASAISMSIMFGRIGSVFGNLLVPVLLQTGCASLCFTLAGITIVYTIISLFLPNTQNKTLD